jgi:diguanylate cyclase (GGDEF)-like protein
MIQNSNEHLREKVNEIANLLCQTINGNFDIVIQFDDQDEVLQKLIMVLNFLLDSVRRNLEYLKQEATVKSQLIGQLEYSNKFDFLTGLQNRKSFETDFSKELARAKRENKKLIFIMIDIDNFKEINDIYGHDIGDELLIGISYRLQSAIRSYDHACRIGGDEFCILLIPVHDDDSNLDIVKRLKKEIEKKIVFREKNFDIMPETSIGTYVFQAQKVESISEVFKKADIALYQAKKNNKGSIVSFVEPMYQEYLTHQKIIELINSNFDDSFYMSIQPIFKYHSRKQHLLGGEFLLRTKKTSEFVIEDIFTVAEDNSLMISLGRKCLNTIFQHISSIEDPSIFQYFFINISVKQMLDRSFVELIQSNLALFNIDPKKIVLEITESSIISCKESVYDINTRLKSLGIRLAIDDFGKGYSSLQRLKDLKVDLLKIDRGFTAQLLQDQNCKHIVEAIVQMSQKLQLELVIEGIETQDQLDAFQALSCSIFQGFYLAKPMPFDKFISLYG